MRIRFAIAAAIVVGASAFVILNYAGAGPPGVLKSNPRPSSDNVLSSDLREEDLERHGIYRIVPYDYAGNLGFRDFGVPGQDLGVKSSDPAVIRTSPLHIDVDRLPAGLNLAGMDTFDGGLNNAARQVFRSDDGSRMIEVSRVRKAVEPIDIYAPPPPKENPTIEDFTDPTRGGVPLFVMRTGFIGEYEAVIFSPIEGIPPAAWIAHVIFYQDGINTSVLGTGVSIDVVIEIAEQVARAAEEKQRG